MPHGGNSLTRMRWQTALVWTALLSYALALTPVVAQEEALALYSKKANYDDVRFDLQNAIISRGLTVVFNGQVSDMLERTGADVGSRTLIYKKAEYFSFCSAKLSRDMMEADGVNVGFCPFVIFIYETAASPGTVHLGYRKLRPRGSADSKAALQAVDTLLAGIAEEAVR